MGLIFDLEKILEGKTEALEEFLTGFCTGIRPSTVDELGEMAAIQPEFQSPRILALPASRQQLCQNVVFQSDSHDAQRTSRSENKYSYTY
jgi:hypothetical protein